MNKQNMRLLLEQLARDDAYGCYSRQGLELVVWPRIADKARWVIFADIDDMHQLNTRLGYAEVDRRIRVALQVRSSDVMATGRYFSGDEIVWVISNGDPEGMIKRLASNLAQQGLSAVFASSPVTSKMLTENVASAAARVQEAKKQKGNTQ
jgi:GGDEF domain-containing protein